MLPCLPAFPVNINLPISIKSFCFSNYKQQYFYRLRSAAVQYTSGGRSRRDGRGVAMAGQPADQWTAYLWWSVNLCPVGGVCSTLLQR